MEDDKLTDLLWEHDEKGLAALKAKHGRLIMKICRGILKSPQDAEECLNDTLLAVWNSIPPDKPEKLTAYTAKVARRKALDRLRYNTAAIRNSDLLTELDECIPSSYRAEDEAERSELSAALNGWLKNQSEKQQRLFVQRYFLMNSVLRSAEKAGMSLTAATTALSRMRKSLKEYLIERGLFNE
ncbi:MAG: sigma-70 family RNA polymerase sigma factor [Oscillospiraceae bacterium]|nr:sigma-70 family RNA polymerase sigma factor [Oscillospiraceae bacterium]